MSNTLKANFNKIEFQTQELDNGLTVVYHKDASAPVVSLVMLYKVGSSDEDDDHTGYAHFFEHLMFEGTKNIPKGKIDDHIQEAGGTLNAMTTMDETIYTYTVPSHQIKLPLWIEAERMRKLKINEEAVEKEKKIVIEELKQRLENEPYRNLLPKALEVLFEGTSYAWHVGGKAEHIEEAELEDFKKFYDKYYHPSNAVLAISGDIEIDRVKEFAKAYFSQYPYKKVNGEKDFDPEKIEEEIEVEMQDKFSDVPLIFECYRTCSRTDNDRYALEILENILVQGNTSKMYKRLVDSLQLTSGVYMFSDYLDKSGYSAIAVPVDTEDKFKKVKAEIDSVINDIVENGITKKELNKAKNYIERSFALRLKMNENKAMLLASYQAFNGNPELINNEFAKYEDITEEDIINAAKKYLSENKRIIIYSVPDNNE